MPLTQHRSGWLRQRAVYSTCSPHAQISEKLENDKLYMVLDVFVVGPEPGAGGSYSIHGLGARPLSMHSP